MRPISRCAVCGGERLVPYGMRDWTPACLHFAQVRCADCGLLCSQPQATRDETDHFYKNVYYQQVWPDPERAYRENTAAYRSYEWRVLQELWEAWPPRRGGAAFEVGCGYGVMLNLLRDEGFTVAGSELSPRAVAVCRSRGLDVEETDSIRHVASGRYDLSLSLHVIEHVLDPSDFVRELVRIVRPGGLVALVTEDGWNVQYALRRWAHALTGRVPPTHTAADHTFVFQRGHLDRLLREAGCDAVRTHSFSHAGVNESLHWKLFKTCCRTLDAWLGHGEYLAAVGRKSS